MPISYRRILSIEEGVSLIRGNKPNTFSKPRNFVVSMGGGDVSFENTKILEALGIIWDHKYNLTVVGNLERGRTFPFGLKIVRTPMK